MPKKNRLGFEQRALEIERKAVSLIPREVPVFLDSASSMRTRVLLFSREFPLLFRNRNTPEVFEATVVRLFAAELIRKAGVRNLGKTSEYNHAKLRVRAEIVRFLNENPAIQERFHRLAGNRQRGIVGRVRKIAWRRKAK